MKLIVSNLINEYLNLYDKKNFLFLRSILLYYRSLEFRVVVLIRIYLGVKNKILKKYFRKKLAIKYNVDIGINPIIGKNLRIAHYHGLIIGNEVVLGDNCVLYQQVTLGQKKNGISGYGDDPIIGNNTIIFAGAKIFGKIKIGNNVMVGANAVVLKDIPDNCIAAGVPAKILDKKVQEI